MDYAVYGLCRGNTYLSDLLRSLCLSQSNQVQDTELLASLSNLHLDIHCGLIPRTLHVIFYVEIYICNDHMNLLLNMPNITLYIMYCKLA